MRMVISYKITLPSGLITSKQNIIVVEKFLRKIK